MANSRGTEVQSYRRALWVQYDFCVPEWPGMQFKNTEGAFGGEGFHPVLHLISSSLGQVAVSTLVNLQDELETLKVHLASGECH